MSFFVCLGLRNKTTCLGLENDSVLDKKMRVATYFMFSWLPGQQGPSNAEVPLVDRSPSVTVFRPTFVCLFGILLQKTEKEWNQSRRAWGQNDSYM